MDKPTKAEQSSIGGIARGDPQALALFYNQWFDFIFSHAKRLTSRDEQFCLDIVQEVMMRIIRSAKPLVSDASISRWLRAVTVSCCIDALRQERRRIARERSRSTKEAYSTPYTIDHEIKWLRGQLAALDPETARLMTLRFRFGWTLQHIAASLGLTTGAVDGRINRTIAKLRANAQEDSHEA